MHEWEEILTPADRELYQTGLYGARQQFKSKPALLIVDVTRSFVGSDPMPILEAVKEYPTSCGGDRDWEALPKIKAVLDAGRRAGVPIIYTRGDEAMRDFASSTTKIENPEARRTFDPRAQDIPEVIAPEQKDLVLDKTKASA